MRRIRHGGVLDIHRAVRLLTILGLFAPWCFAQSVFTVAGGGTDEGRPATLASVVPSAIAVDSSGDLFIADSLNDRVRKVTLASGTVTTVAGNGTRGYSGDGGPASAAALYAPSGVAVDGSGNLYIADSYNNRIRMVAKGSGIITTVAGNNRNPNFGFSGDGGPATEAALWQPTGVCVDGYGNLFIVDSGNSRIRKVEAASGIIFTVAGNGSRDFSGDGSPATMAGMTPRSVAADRTGNLFISGNNRVRRIAAGDEIIRTIAGNGDNAFSGDGGAATAAALNGPAGIAAEGAGNLFIADLDNHRVRRVSPNGIITTLAGNGNYGSSGDGNAATAAEMKSPTGVTVDGAGNLYVADPSDRRVRAVAAGSVIITTVAGNGASAASVGDGGAATAAGLDGPIGVAVDSSGNLFVADEGHYRVRKVSAASGVMTTVAGNGAHGFGGDGGPATIAKLSDPVGVAVDPAGNLFIADSEDHRIRRVAAVSGFITTVAGNGNAGSGGEGGAATAAALNTPRGVAVDRAGNLFIADALNRRIRRVDSATGIITTPAGSGISGFSGDGGPATAARLSYCWALAVDAAGNLIIADSANNRIRMVVAGSGIIVTVAGNGTFGFSGDGGAPTAASLAYPRGVAVTPSGDLLIADWQNSRIRKVAAATGIISTLAGTGTEIFSGDGGPATSAGLNPFGVAVDGDGNAFVSGDNRVRLVPACPAGLTAPSPTSPANGSSGVTTSPKLEWAQSRGAFRYDIILDTVNPPTRVLVSDVESRSFSPTLQPATTYFWKVVAKGDPFCQPPRNAGSETRSFTTQATCSAPGEPSL